MNLRELMTSTPYTTVHAPHRGHVAYSTRKRFGTEVERVAHINLCDHPSLTRLRALAHLATIPLPIYNREGARTVKKDDYAIHYDDGHVLAVTITRPHSSNGTRNAEATRGLAYDALILDVTTQELHQQHDGSYSAPPLQSRCVLVCSSSHGLVAKTSSKSYATGGWLLGSRFTGVCVARHGVSARLMSPPRAFWVSGALPATLMLMAAFKSRSMTRPQCSHL